MSNDPFTSMALSSSAPVEREPVRPEKLKIDFGSIFWPVLVAQLTIGLLAAIAVAIARS